MKLTKSIEFVVEKPLEATMDNFIDLQKYVKLHPLMVKTDLVATNTYKLYEQPFAWIPFQLTYFAHLIHTSNKLTYVLEGVPFTKARFDYEFTEINPNKTKATLAIQLNGLPVANQIIMKLMIDAQQTIFDLLDQE
jgi:hypothetical protein